MKMRLILALVLCCFSLSAAAQNVFTQPDVKARLYSPMKAVGPLALEFTLPPGWHTYWRNPGVAGAPPQLDWTGSTNFVSAEILWPAPKRYTLENLQTFGYDGQFVLPLSVTLQDRTAPAHLQLAIDLVVCTEICVPAHLTLAYDLPAQAASQEDMIRWHEAMTRLPVPYANAGITIDQFSLNGDVLTLKAQSRAGWQQPDLILEAPNDIPFGKPDVTVNGTEAIFAVKLSNAPDAKELKNGTKVKLTFVDTAISADGDATVGGVAAPANTPASPGEKPLLYIIALALLGGLILNLMPCVLPVLSLKLLSVVQHAGETRAQIRRGFLASSLGILTSFWIIAGGLLIVKHAGMALGWGIQFQHPLFLSLLLTIVLGFAANLFGWFEIALPQPLQSKLGGPLIDREVPTAKHEFFTGMLATLLATPCTAPFVGTSVGFALAGNDADILAIFTALGVGLAIPYLMIALFPVLAQKLPRPGRWMLALRALLGLALIATALWLFSILYLQLGMMGIILIGVLAISYLLLLWSRNWKLAFALALFMIVSPLALEKAQTTTQQESSSLHWLPFDPSAVPAMVAQGKVVFIDITAEWCLTCHANEKLVLDTNKVQSALTAPNIVLMRGDWTQPSDAITAFLKSHQRAGIPFNMVVGPHAPDGIVLPELLTPGAITDALEKAQ